MNLKHIEFVIAAAAEHSFSRAAARCHVTQPTLSNGISMLEHQLGGQLFVRTTRKVELSPFGERILPLIQALHRAHRELKAGAESFYDPAHQLIRVGLSPLADARRIADALEPYTRAHPACQTVLKECVLDDLEERLHGAQLDLVIMPRLRQATTPRSVVATPFYTEEMYYLSKSPRASASPQVGSVTLQDIADDVFVLGPDGCGLAAFTRDLFKTAELRLREYRGQALSYQVMQEWADLGIGSAILPASKIAAQFRPRANRIVDASRRPVTLAFQALWMRQAAYPRHVGLLHEHFRSIAPAGDDTSTPSPLRTGTGG